MPSPPRWHPLPRRRSTGREGLDARRAAPAVSAGLIERDYDRGRALFAAAKCFACHRCNDEGGGVGPDLTGVAGRFSTKDLLESIIVPSKTISDQYESVTIATSDGRVVTGRIVNLHGDNLMINPDMLDPNNMVNVPRSKIEDMKRSPVSMMPVGLLNTLHKDEILDLVAYLLCAEIGRARCFVMYQRRQAGLPRWTLKVRSITTKCPRRRWLPGFAVEQLDHSWAQHLRGLSGPRPLEL